MAENIFGPRKQRTRGHVLADLSINHVERFILEEGHTTQRMNPDYGYDLFLFTFDEQGYFEPGHICIQVKAAESLHVVGDDHVFDLDVRDYNLWMREEVPVILILFDASRRRACWVCVQEYFREDAARQPKKGAKTVRVRIPTAQVLNRRAIARMRDLKEETMNKPTGEGP
jgi:hypothetical protein